MVSSFYEKLKKEKRNSDTTNCFISATPGSFYEKLFPKRLYGLFMLLTVCIGFLRFLNRLKIIKKIFTWKTSPPNVFKANFEQFQKDFTSFLSLRAEVIICGGRIGLTVTGRKSLNPSSAECCRTWELLAEILMYLVSQGQVEEKVYSFNVPVYTPCADELRDIITKEGSFDLNFIDVFEVNWDANEDRQNTKYKFDEKRSGKNVAKIVRAAMEPLLISRSGFGDEILNDLFFKYAELIAKHLAQEKSKHANVIMSMTRKA